MRGIRIQILTATFLVGLSTSGRAADALSQLGTNAQQASDDALAGLEYSQLPWGPARAAFKTASPEQRAELVKAGLGWAKAYFASPEFKAAYEKLRNDRKPASPETRGTIDEELAKYRKEVDDSIAQMQKSVEAMPEDQRKSVEASVKESIEILRKQQADPEMQKLQRQGLEIQREAEQNQYKQDLADWEKKFPEDSRVLIAQRVNEWLEKCKDVDFAAEMDSTSDKTRFADSALEQKPHEWKTCYRAGKPALDAAREFANAWLVELKP